MKILLPLFLSFYLVNIQPIYAGKIYKWLDVEGIKQFSHNPPPKTCKTTSCIKLNKKITKQLRRKKQVEQGRIEADRTRQEELELERKRQKLRQQQEIIKLVPPSESERQKTFLDVHTIICISFNNMREYKNVKQARKYLERDKHCIKTSDEMEYTMIEKQELFSNIRIYLKDESSLEKWVETQYLSR